MAQRPNIIAAQRCAFCLSPVPRDSAQKRYGDAQEISCPCCGTYVITGSAIDVIPRWDISDAKWAAIAYHLKRMTDRATAPRLDTEVLRALEQTAQLPHPDQILDDLVLWWGQHSRWPGDAVDVRFTTHHTLVGAVEPAAFRYMLDCMVTSGLFTGSVIPLAVTAEIIGCALTALGWSRFRELSTSHAGSRYGFMAMKYDDPELDAIVREHFAPQVKLAGFDLLRLDDGQAAGLIDDQLRLKIRQAKFLVCDLTHGNRGAYWEAGYAEGLGAPVIYTCRRDVFDDRNHPNHPHFDASHWVTVPWDVSDPAKAASKLKVTVRVTFPAQARLTD